MKRIKLRNYHKNKNTINKIMLIVFFLSLILAIVLFNNYGKNITDESVELINQKTDKIIYDFFNDLITDDIINKENVNNILDITKNKRDEILTVNYDLEKSYKMLTILSSVLKKAIIDLENGKIDVEDYDKYLTSSKNGLVLNIPLFLNSDNIFINNLGPRIPVLINFNENLLTNLKTKVTNYGFNNALLEVYVTVEMQKLIITPVKKYDDKFYYEILIGAIVVNGSVPEFYGSSYESASSILSLPLD